ncbi:hypothetical protein DICPUDRAFT_160438 [Dictyostelium purpureum]|uniref:Uncharacterized protein n=1 Tax=Dictyostelium purpureum TaxID=5786 RepID=F1A6C2_DICPU|nr:hypothetical protein DICPUDRAFT_160438 [Dictyostelium purpureum]|eukprot:XP_003295216.1 hypothetical protein DICPUDRAFT_160438 [Dictyostelium purpureum]
MGDWHGSSAIISITTNTFGVLWVKPNNIADRGIYLRQVYCVTALSTFDGTGIGPTMVVTGASLVPAAAVIPAPIAYTKVVAVKKLVVEVKVLLG